MLCAVSPTGRVFAYAPTTQLWHLRHDLAPDALPDADQLAPDAVASAMARIPRPNERFSAGKAAADRLRAQIARAGEVVTSAETGLTLRDLPGSRPITAPGLGRLLEARGRHWTTVARYDESAERTAPYKAVQNYRDIRRFAFSLDAVQELDAATGHVLIRIRG